ncbi:MAG: hypothetical protein WKF84_01210 [Pyrinomonadaceae bacterium]
MAINSLLQDVISAWLVSEIRQEKPHAAPPYDTPLISHVFIKIRFEPIFTACYSARTHTGDILFAGTPFA